MRKVLGLGCWFLAGVSGMSAQSVPSVYQGLWNQFAVQDCTAATCAWPNPPGNSFVGAGDLADFSAYISSLGSGAAGTLPAGQLTAANANNGPALLNTNNSLPLIQKQILGWKAVGAKAISMEVSFPMLYQPFLDGAYPGYYAQFTAFYSLIAGMIRAQGMRVIVEEMPLLAGGATGSLQSGNWPTLSSFYATFNGDLTTVGMGGLNYPDARGAGIANVIATMHPDYVVMLQEPDTTSSQSSIPAIATVSGAVTVLNASIPAARAAITACNTLPGSPCASTKIGAGFGAWLQAFQSFANAFTHQNCGVCLNSSNNLDFLDLHVYPIDENVTYCGPNQGSVCTSPAFWWNTMRVVNTAQTGICSNGAGCQVSISQCWLRKVANGEWLQNVGGSCSGNCGIGDIEEARETFGFWSPLDLSFMQVVYNLAQYAGFVFVAPFNTQNLFAAITWTQGNPAGTTGDNLYPDGNGACQTPCGNMQAATVFQTEQSTSNINLAAAAYTPTATGIHDIWTGGQSAAPTTPAQVTAIRTSAGAATIFWTPSADDVGVAGYQVARGGITLASVLVPPFQDSGLAAGTTYIYQVRAFNLGTNGVGNYSGWSGSVPARQIGGAIAGYVRVSGHTKIQ